MSPEQSDGQECAKEHGRSVLVLGQKCPKKGDDRHGTIDTAMGHRHGYGHEDGALGKASG